MECRECRRVAIEVQDGIDSASGRELGEECDRRVTDANMMFAAPRLARRSRIVSAAVSTA